MKTPFFCTADLTVSTVFCEKIHASCRFYINLIHRCECKCDGCSREHAGKLQALLACLQVVKSCLKSAGLAVSRSCSDCRQSSQHQQLLKRSFLQVVRVDTCKMQVCIMWSVSFVLKDGNSHGLDGCPQDDKLEYSVTEFSQIFDCTRPLQRCRLTTGKHIGMQ